MNLKKITFLVILFSIAMNTFTAPLPLLGDANSDGKVNIVDALLIAQFYVDPETQANTGAMDVDCNSSIDIIDALLVARFYVGLVDELSLCVNGPYPSQFEPYGKEEIASLQEEFNSLNNGKISGTVGKYGFLVSHTLAYADTPRGNPLTDQEEVMRLARRALIRNTKFTNVTSETNLAKCRVIHPTASSNWTLEFRFSSFYDNIPAVFTTIVVEVNRDVYLIKGHYYPQQISIPRVLLQPEEAQQACIGQTLEFYNIAGELVTVTVTEEWLDQVPSGFMLVPYINGSVLEYRYCWVVSVSDHMWSLFVDVVTGEVVGSEQHFMT